MHTVFPPGIGRWGTILALGLAAWAFAAGGQALADDPCGCNDGCNPPGFWTGSEAFPRNPWYVSADAMAMQRLFTGMGPVASLGVSPTAAWALTQNDLDQPFQSGAQLLIGHTFDDSPYQVEVSYFWLSPWNTTAQAISPQGNLFSPFTNWGSPTANPEVDDNSSVSIHQISRLEGGEFNVKTAIPLPAGDPTIVLMFGVRHVAIREEFDYASVPTGNINPVSVARHTNNDLWGPQIGGVIEYGHQDVLDPCRRQGGDLRQREQSESGCQCQWDRIGPRPSVPNQHGFRCRHQCGHHVAADLRADGQDRLSGTLGRSNRLSGEKLRPRP